jgi:hypothetical protein
MPALTREFLVDLKRLTEEAWSVHQLDPSTYGGQFQRGTRWNPGLSETEIGDYEQAIGTHFPADFKLFLSIMNGTDLPTLNIYGSSGIRPREGIGVYSFPRDVDEIQSRIARAKKDRDGIAQELTDQGFDLPATAGLIPIYAHRYLVSTFDPNSSVVLSIDGTDAIVYGNSLREYLEREFLEHHLRAEP